LAAKAVAVDRERAWESTRRTRLLISIPLGRSFCAAVLTLDRAMNPAVIARCLGGDVGFAGGP